VWQTFQPGVKIQEKDVRGLKYFDQLASPYSNASTTSVANAISPANSRSALRSVLHAHLALLFNPVVKSLRGLQAGQRTQERPERKSSAAPDPRSDPSPNRSMSSIPERLKEIIAELGGQLEPLGRDPRL